jgi:nitroreductase
MNVLAAIQSRRSIRLYSDRPVEEEKLRKILEAGRLSPSAGNMQNWKFIVVRDEDLREQLTEAAYSQMFVAQSPIILVLCSTDPDGIMKCGQPKSSVDVSIATSFMILEAAEQGLGTCWLGSFKEDMVKKILGIPDYVRVVAMTPLGYPGEAPAERPRRKTDEIVCYDRWDT